MAFVEMLLGNLLLNPPAAAPSEEHGDHFVKCVQQENLKNSVNCVLGDQVFVQTL